MGMDNYISMREGALVLVTENDGPAYLRERPGEHWQAVTPITLEQVASRFGLDSPHYKRALALLTAEG